MLYVAVIDYAKPAIIIEKFTELDDSASNETVEHFLSTKGYKLSEIHYLTSNEPIPLFADSNNIDIVDSDMQLDEEK